MKSAVTFSLSALLLLPAMGCAQDRPSARHDAAGDPPSATGQHRTAGVVSGDEKQLPDSDKTPRRLETVTWNSVNHELTWVISKGEKKGAAFKPLGAENYVINMDDATMAYSGARRRFSKEEAANVHVLMDLIAKYAIDSTIWWDDGQGEPIDGKGNGKSPAQPEQPRKHNLEDGKALHVAYRTGETVRPELSACAIQEEIDTLERRLVELKQLQHDQDKHIQLVSYSAGPR